MYIVSMKKVLINAKFKTDFWEIIILIWKNDSKVLQKIKVYILNIGGIIWTKI